MTAVLDMMCMKQDIEHDVKNAKMHLDTTVLHEINFFIHHQVLSFVRASYAYSHSAEEQKELRNSTSTYYLNLIKISFAFINNVS